MCSANDIWHADATAPIQRITDDPNSPQLLRRLTLETFSWQMRNETSIQKALRSPRTAPRWMAALLALGATVTVEGEATEMAVAHLLERRTQGEVVALHIPTSGMVWGEACVRRTPADDPIVAVVATVALENGVVRQARLALTGVWAEPVRLASAGALLAGRLLDEATIHTIARAVENEVTPQGDFLGSAEYRRAMAAVLTRRALAQCMHFATGE
ncbi:MAG: hypothetical protein N2508_00530 [Anaerolineae bacterium]|nr:hypothetical protein [Anaerolineae bacterium]